MLSFLVEGAGEGSNIMRVSVLIDRECLSTVGSSRTSSSRMSSKNLSLMSGPVPDFLHAPDFSKN